MDKFTTHAVFRSYLAIGRAEHFTPSELGDEIDFSVRGEIAYSLPATQINFYSSREVEAAIEKFWKRDFEQAFKAGVMPKPGRLENIIICSELRKKFDLTGVCQFDKDGELNFPRHADFFVAKKDGNLIEKFLFYKVEKDGIKRIG